MTPPNTMRRQAIETVERRAFEARFTMSAVCGKAGVTPQAWSGAKQRGSIGVDLLAKIEKALSALEAEKSRG